MSTLRRYRRSTKIFLFVKQVSFRVGCTLLEIDVIENDKPIPHVWESLAQWVYIERNKFLYKKCLNKVGTVKTISRYQLIAKTGKIESF